MEEVKSSSQSWAFTVKKLGSNIFQSDYDFVMKIFNKHGKVFDHIYEKDSHGIIHIHGIIQLDKKFHRKRLCIHGYHVKLVEIFDHQGWLEYMYKDVSKEPLPQETLKDLFNGDSIIPT